MASSIKGDKYAFYQPHRQQKIERSNKVVAKKDLSRALKLEEFKVVYQPQISLKTGIITSCEAILRWQHPLHGDISLAQFISTAEKTDLLVPISLWFLEKTAQQLNHWQQNGFRQLKLAIKIVGVHFYQDNFDLDIANILQKYRLNYGTLTLEMRENTLLQNKLKAQAKLKVMRNLGVNLTLDEFGTGYTNLNYWQEFPFNNIKLDWHRLQSVFKRDRSHQISQASINLAHQQGLKTIVTGIGTTADWQFVAQEKWDLIQGDYLSQPLSALEFSRLLQINS
ncbi:MAG: EAL domain-containing protein [Cyanobacteria bacterium J083]|nr:MAG: EAL domain-containing protein [Cyanobacteria bacterium J083]